LITRFSEDIDITVFREDLGQGATVVQLEALSRKKRNTRLDEIKLACQQYISVQLRETLGGLIDQTCQRSAVAAGQFRVTVDEDDLDSFYDWWRRIFTYLERRKVRPAKVSELMNAVVI